MKTILLQSQREIIITYETDQNNQIASQLSPKPIYLWVIPTKKCY